MSKGDGSDMLSALVEPSQKPGALERAGGWLFRQRTWLPVPIAAALLLIPPDDLPQHLSTSLAWLGVPIVALGELLRLWAVHHIGVISRTRSDRLGPLIDTGPFSLLRNPLYVGNILLWTGFAVSARLPWLVPVVLLLLALEYHAIVRWEERLLEARLGDSYRRYAANVPRWIPKARAPSRLQSTARFSWGDTFFSERGTLIAIAVGYVLLWLKT
jgi:protein-S-isoprenylcysteine O-methyltransferase Ste14